MNHNSIDSRNTKEVTELFTSVFTSSEGEEEGKLIGKLVSKLAPNIDPTFRRIGFQFSRPVSDVIFSFRD